MIQLDDELIHMVLKSLHIEFLFLFNNVFVSKSYKTRLSACIWQANYK